MITGHVAPGATIYTDEHAGYRDLPYHHETVCHSAGAYVNGKASTNSTEPFWALLKRAYVGTHHWWSTRHCFRYVAEYEHHQNTIDLSGDLVLGRLLRAGGG